MNAITQTADPEALAAESQVVNESTKLATNEDMISPRFYTTDFAAFDKLDIGPVREEWDRMMAEFENDANKKHFRKDEDYSHEIRPLPDALDKEFRHFLVTSLTSEFSGCVLYADIKTNIKNPEIKKLMGYMSRDEARHAGFINEALKVYDLGIDLGFLKKTKAYTFFKPKYIFYATYLSEKIGYARYITIYRALEKNPENRFHPIYRYFLEWCNDEFRHGEAFALIMRADPSLQKGINKWWIRFFLLAVYATMYVRDHSRPELHKALGVDITEYDHQVFDITTDLSRQCFPVCLDTHSPKFRAGLETLREVNEACMDIKKRSGLGAKLALMGQKLKGFTTFFRLFFHPVIENKLPDEIRREPTW